MEETLSVDLSAHNAMWEETELTHAYVYIEVDMLSF